MLKAELHNFVHERASKFVEQFGGALSVADLFRLGKMVVEEVKKFEAMPQASKNAAAKMLASYVIRHTDTPWLPDNLTDPLMESGMNVLIDWVCPADAPAPAEAVSAMKAVSAVADKAEVLLEVVDPVANLLEKSDSTDASE